MRGVFKSLFLLLLIVGIFFALSFVVNVSAKVTHTSVVKNVVPNVNVWNPFPPPIKDDDGIAGNVWNPFPPPIKKEKGGDGIASNVWNPFPPPIKDDDDGVAVVTVFGGSVWNPFPPPIKKDDGDGRN